MGRAFFRCYKLTARGRFQFLSFYVYSAAEFDSHQVMGAESHAMPHYAWSGKAKALRSHMYNRPRHDRLRQRELYSRLGDVPTLRGCKFRPAMPVLPADPQFPRVGEAFVAPKFS